MERDLDTPSYFDLQVFVKQEGRGHNQVTRTINPSTMLSLPEGGMYIIEVRALSEGGEGAVSSQVRIVTSSGKLKLTIGAFLDTYSPLHDPLCSISVHSCFLFAATFALPPVN